jgi:hypothetical protein
MYKWHSVIVETLFILWLKYVVESIKHKQQLLLLLSLSLLLKSCLDIQSVKFMSEMLNSLEITITEH